MPNPKIAFKDKNFSHEDKKDFTYFSWTTEYSPKLTVFTDMCVKDVQGYFCKHKVAWLVEPKAFHPQAYEFVLTNPKLFDHVFTADKNFIAEFSIPERISYSSFASRWVTPMPDPKKTGLISILASDKYFLPGHKLRHAIIDAYPVQIDAYGPRYRPISLQDALKQATGPYYYNILVENVRVPGWTTERVISAMLQKAVPIYWGAPDIGEYFDMDGIICFDTVEDLTNILPKLSAFDYDSRTIAIEHNFELAHKYLYVQDNLWLAGLKEIYERTK